jgi:amino acid permease
MCDLLQSVLFTAICVFKVSEAMSMLVSGNDYLTYLPGWFMAVYAFILLIALPGGRCFWVSMSGFTIMTIVLLLIYCLGNAPKFNFPAYASIEVPLFEGDSYDFMKQLIAPAICFVGVDFITLFTDEAKNPQRDLPRSMIGAVTFTIIMAFWVTLTVMSINPGVSFELTDDKIIFATYFGLRDLFIIDYAKANFLIAPTLFSGAAGYLFSAARQMHSMSKSGLLPQCFSITYGTNQVPISAMLTTALVGLIVLFPLWAANPKSKDVYNLAMIGASAVYLSLFWCYLLFKWSYGSMDRQFTNPLGAASAIFGIMYFSVVMITLLFVQLNYRAVSVFASLMGMAILYYYKVVESRQFFSKEEQQKFMKAYILNANRKRKKGLSPYMKRVRQMYLGLKIDSIFGSWTLTPAQGSLVSSNQSIATSSALGSRKSERSTQGTSGKMSVSTGPLSPSSPTKNASSSDLTETDVAISSASSISGNSYKVVPIVPFSSPATVIVVPNGGSVMTDAQVVAEIVKIKALADFETSVHIKASAALNPSTAVAASAEETTIVGMTWSGKLMNDDDSRKVFKILLENNNGSRKSSHASLHAAAQSNANESQQPANPSSGEILMQQFPEQFARTPANEKQTQDTWKSMAKDCETLPSSVKENGLRDVENG